MNWMDWSAAELVRLAHTTPLVIDPVIYSEVSIGFDRIEDLDEALPVQYFRREPIPWEAAFLAVKAFLRYGRSRGRERSPLPDFFTGAHAAIRGHPLLTRDRGRCETCFPTVELIGP